MNEDKKETKMTEEKSWEYFKDNGFLWLVNSFLHTFGWAIVFDYEDDKKTFIRAYPARVKFRGFPEKSNTNGYIKVSEYLQKNIDDLVEESKN